MHTKLVSVFLFIYTLQHLLSKVNRNMIILFSTCIIFVNLCFLIYIAVK